MKKLIMLFALLFAFPLLSQTTTYKGNYLNKDLTLKITEDDPRAPKILYTIDDLTYAGSWRKDMDGLIRGEMYAFDSYLGEFGGEFTIVLENEKATVYFSGNPKVLMLDIEPVVIEEEPKTGEELDTMDEEPEEISNRED